MRANPFTVAALLAGAFAVALACFAEGRNMLLNLTSIAAPYSVGELPPLDNATAWLNTEPLTREQLRGKVVVVQFWTFTCINWLRTMPHIRAWADKYKDQGLIVIGVHAPEFEFEKDVEKVRRAAKDLNVEFPVAVDSDHAIWRAFNNQYWPALYLVDAKGRIRHHHFGEGEYESTEAVIQKLLAEAGAAGLEANPAAVDARGIEVAADWSNLGSPESYLGFERADNFSSPGGATPGEPRVYTMPTRLSVNDWALSGDWTVRGQGVALNKANGRIAYRFHARDLHLVMGPKMQGTSVRFRVLIDGKPPGAAHGGDIDAEGYGTSRAQRLYQLVRQSKQIDDRLFEIEFLDPGVEAFAFTFG